MSSYGPSKLFLPTFTPLDSCEGLCQLLMAHGIPLHLLPTCWCSWKAGRLSTTLSPLSTPCAALLQPCLHNDSPTPKTIESVPVHSCGISTPHPQLLVKTTTCQNIVDILTIPTSFCCRSRFFSSPKDELAQFSIKSNTCFCPWNCPISSHNYNF